MSNLPLELKDDQFLIKWLQENDRRIPFIGSREKDFAYGSPKGKTHKLISQLSAKEDLHIGPNFDLVLKLWKELLGDALVYLKSQDEREKYHDIEIFGVDDLSELLSAFRRFEHLLYGSSEYYRDHVTHVFRVFLLGFYLVRTTFDFREIDAGDRILPESDRISPEEKEAMWCVIALTHDLGLALEKIDEISKKVRGMIEQYGKMNITEMSYAFPNQSQAIDHFILQFISSDLAKDNREKSAKSTDAEVDRKQPEQKLNQYVTHLQSKYFMKFSRAYETVDHGVLSCMVLMKNLVYFLESDYLLDAHRPLKSQDGKQFLIRRTILRSIASHHLDAIYHLTLNNFPFLLLLFDEMQEWGRPRLRDVFRREIPKSVLVVDEMDARKATFTVELSTEKEPSRAELKALKTNAKLYFVAKCKKWIKVLRSAVGGEIRNIELTFRVRDQFEPHPDTYELKHLQPGPRDRFLKVEITCNGSKTSLLQLQVSALKGETSTDAS